MSRRGVLRRWKPRVRPARTRPVHLRRQDRRRQGHDRRRPNAHIAESRLRPAMPWRNRTPSTRTRREDRTMSDYRPEYGGPWYKRVYDWLERRIQIEGPVKEAVLHPVPKSTASWWYVFGSASLT